MREHGEELGDIDGEVSEEERPLVDGEEEKDPESHCGVG